MHRKRIFSIVVLVLLTSGCMVTEQDLMTQRKLMELQRRVDESDRTLKALTGDQSGSVRARLETLARNQADFQASLDSLRVDVQSMQGRSDDLDRGRGDLRQDLMLMRDELSLQMADLQQRIAQLEETRQPAAAASSGADMPTAAPAAGSTPAPDIPVPAAATPEGMYERALEVLRAEKQFEQGRDLMMNFLKRYPEDPLAINAAYWIGEAYYAEKDYEKAILQFEDVIQKYGDHPKVAAALFKQGMAFDQLDDRASARLLLQRIIERFPESGEAEKAEATLQEWGG